MIDTIQEMEAKLGNDMPLTSRIDILNEIAKAYKESDSSKSLKYSNEALRLSELCSYKKGLMESHYLLGLNYLNIYNPDLAIENLEFALRLSEDLGDVKTKIAVNHSKAAAFRMKSVYEKAIEIFHENLKLCEKENETEYRILELESIGAIYTVLGEVQLALEYMLSAVKLCVANQIDFPDRLLNDLGIAFREAGDSDSALEYFYKVFISSKKKNDWFAEVIARLNIADLYASKHIKLYELANDIIDECFDLLNETSRSQDQGRRPAFEFTEIKSSGQNTALDFKIKELHICKRIKAGYEQEAVLLSEIGDIYFADNNFEQAKEYYTRSINLYKEKDLRTFETRNYVGLGRIYLSLNEHDKGLEYLHKALRIATKSKVLKDSISANEALYLAYKNINDLEKSLYYHEKYFQLVNELHNLKLDKQIKTVTILNEVEKAERDKVKVIRENEMLSLTNKRLEKMTEELMAISEKKDEQIDITAHDLKNPLFNIFLLSKKIQKDINKFDPEKISKASGEIHKSSQRMLDIINHVLEINAIESRSPSPEIIDPCELAESVVNGFRENASAKNIKINYCSHILPDIVLDKPYVLLIIENLVSNAVKFTSPGKNIYLDVSISDDKIRFEITDEGPGLHEGDKAMLFKKYSRLSAKPTGGESSTGLGLYIAKRITEILNGRIWCESEYGEGAKFIVELPAIIKEKNLESIPVLNQ